MTRDATHPTGGIPPWTGRLRTLYTILISALLVLTMGMFFAWVYAELSAILSDIGHQAAGPWARLAWAATWGLMAALALCGLVVPGLMACVRPALIARLRLLRGIRRWLRLTGLAMLWSGVWMIAFALTTLAQAFRAPPAFLPPFRDMDMAFGVTFAVAFVPFFTLTLAARLARPNRRWEPAAEDSVP